MKALVEIIKILLRNKDFWKVVASLAVALLDLLREQRSATNDDERRQKGEALQRKLDEAHLKRLEFEVELKRRELELQKAQLQLDTLKIELRTASTKRQVLAAQKSVAIAEGERLQLSEKVDEVGTAVTILREVEIAADARDVDALQRLNSALVVVDASAKK